MDSIKDEIRFLLSGQGMPYQKVSLVVAVIIGVFFTLALYNNSIRDARVVIIDLDNSKYSRELAQKIDASPFMKSRLPLRTLTLTNIAAVKTLFWKLSRQQSD